MARRLPMFDDKPWQERAEDADLEHEAPAGPSGFPKDLEPKREPPGPLFFGDSEPDIPTERLAEFEAWKAKMSIENAHSDALLKSVPERVEARQIGASVSLDWEDRQSYQKTVADDEPLFSSEQELLGMDIRRKKVDQENPKEDLQEVKNLAKLSPSELAGQKAKEQAEVTEGGVDDFSTDFNPDGQDEDMASWRASERGDDLSESLGLPLDEGDEDVEQDDDDLTRLELLKISLSTLRKKREAQEGDTSEIDAQIAELQADHDSLQEEIRKARGV